MLSYVILFYLMLSYFISFHLILSHFVLFCLVSSHKCAKSGFVPSKWNETANGVSEVLLGTCRVPLIGLLSRNTGTRYFPIFTPPLVNLDGNYSETAAFPVTHSETCSQF